ncbi:hypothetical protein [Mesorhizobium huakuii]|uniref:Uncharacterized protein n=1 Tax=Mesorhizobium huakuii TaxID=28104 RepID=A0A7G6SL44_9HYPH|nr:hypothetical protein [Mesorhizobium huakuii]QND55226.1 hypothetical protein HB778_01110 [Mesorhizobium huakuii]
MTVVPVLITNCQVSEKPKNGPLTAQTTMIRQQPAKVSGMPAMWATRLAILVKKLFHLSRSLNGCRDEKQPATVSGSHGRQIRQAQLDTRKARI